MLAGQEPQRNHDCGETGEMHGQRSISPPILVAVMYDLARIAR
jgi:hypothetical protein